MTKLKLLNNLVLVEPEQEETRAGIVVPENARDTNFAVAKIIGSGRRIKGIVVPIPLEAGDRVLLSPMGGRREMDFDGRKHLIVDADNILAVIGK